MKKLKGATGQAAYLWGERPGSRRVRHPGHIGWRLCLQSVMARSREDVPYHADRKAEGATVVVRGGAYDFPWDS